jgi:hypothetical protein
MTTTKTPLPAQEQPVISAAGKRMRPITPREVFQFAQWEMDFRFVREVEYLEREGRVSNRNDLEAAIGLGRGEILAIRAGKRQVGLVQVKMLHEKYRGDRDYIMFGQRNKELAAPYIAGIGRIDRYEPYIFQYKSPARWRIGSRPETQPEYFPSDPENTEWKAPEKMPSKVKDKKE